MTRNMEEIPIAVGNASWLAAEFNKMKGLRTRPLAPPTNLFHLILPDTPGQLLARACDWVENTGVMVMPMPRAYAPGGSVIEFNIGSAMGSIDRNQLLDWLYRFYQQS